MRPELAMIASRQNISVSRAVSVLFISVISYQKIVKIIVNGPKDIMSFIQKNNNLIFMETFPSDEIIQYILKS